MNCPRKYKNLGEEAFGDQKVITVEMLRQFCRNDAYLYGEVMDLWNESKPVSRKRFKPLVLDEDNSFGTVTTSDGRFGFDESNNKTVNVNFDCVNDYNKYIDTAKSTTVVDSRISNGAVAKQVTLPKVKNGTKHDDTKAFGPWNNMSCNEHWYIGYDKTKHYETRPNWLANHLNSEIPGICRAQTFKPKHNGRLEGITLNLKGGTNTGSPLYVQIRRTKPINGVLTPVDSSQPCLAQSEERFSKYNPGYYTVTFDNPPYLNKNETYAIVLLSPLSHHTNCYAVGGWSAGCWADRYPDGNAFLSENNGNTWMLYGKKDDVAYHLGMKAPQDFAFQCHIVEEKEEYVKNKDYWLYFKPIMSNPVKSIQLANIDDGDNTNTYSIEYYASNDGRTWKKFGSNLSVNFDTPGQVTFIKAKLRTTSTSSAPWIKQVNVILSTDKPKVGYARTPYYTPKLSPMLGANVWGTVNAPSSVEYAGKGQADVEVEVVSENIKTEHFQLIEPDSIVDYLPAIRPYLETANYNKILTDLSNASAEYDKYKYLVENKWILDKLAEQGVYVIGCENDNGEQQPVLFDGIQLANSPAYPTSNCILSVTTSSVPDIPFGEWYDYTFDYTNDVINFTDTVKNSLIAGVLSIEYNPVFVQDITSSEMPFKLDYCTETFLLADEDIEANKVVLRMPPHDPIRRVLVNPDPEVEDTEKITQLFEDIDYSVDYNNNSLIFNENTGLIAGDTLQVTYTPDLEDSSISIGYWFNREDTLSRVFAEHSYIEYKT